MGGVDKPSLAVGGAPMAARAVAAAAGAGAHRIVVVGRDPQLGAAVTLVTAEDPPGSGPVAAVTAGLAHVTSAEVAVLATDLPFLTAAAVAALRGSLTDGAAAAVAVDGEGRDQPLLAVWRTAALRTALAALGDPVNRSMRALVGAAPAPVVRVAGLGRGGVSPWFDCDTPADLLRARALADPRARPDAYG